jgi:hypothetical protein
VVLLLRRAAIIGRCARVGGRRLEGRGEEEGGQEVEEERDIPNVEMHHRGS